MLLLLLACGGEPPPPPPPGGDVTGAGDSAPGPDSAADSADDSADSAPEPTCEPLGFALWRSFTDEDGLPARDSPGGTIPGVALGDLDGDGDLDVLFAYGGGAAVLFNDGAGALTLDDAPTADGQPLPPAVATALADLDGDGDLDAWLGRPRGQDDLLLTNQGDGTFASMPLEGSAGTPGSGVFGDLDGDGDLDLLVSGFIDDLDIFDVLEGGAVGGPTLIYEGDGAGWLGLTAGRLPADAEGSIGFQPALIDADDDGDLDIYMANDAGNVAPGNLLLVNDGAGIFQRAQGCGCEIEMASMGASVGDVNHDGLPDLLISDFGPPTLLAGQGGAAFVDVTLAAGAEIPLDEHHSAGWGTLIADLDRDACPDMVVTYGESASGNPDFEDYPDQYDQVLISDCGGGFTREEPFHPGFEDAGRTRVIAAGDLDGDGRLDLVTAGKHFLRIWGVTGGCPPGLRLRLDAGPGNRQGFGAKVVVEAAGRRTTQWMLPGTAGGASAPELVLGLGASGEGERLEVTWPSGAVSVVEGIEGGEMTLVE